MNPKPALHLLPQPRSIQLDHTQKVHRPQVQLSIDPSRVTHSQGYELSLTGEQCLITAHDEAGLFYGQKTYQQIQAQADASDLIHPCKIKDHPDFKTRGFMLDVSRGRVPTMAFAKELIDQLAGWKINQLQLYTEHTFAYQGHECVWENASPFTPSEIQALDTYCAQRHIELVPNQNSFGHMARWLSHTPYRHLAECENGFLHPLTGKFTPSPFSLDPSNPETLRLLDDLYTQLLPNFRSGQFNVGCDETFDLGQGKNKSRCEKEGTGHVYLKHLLGVYDLCQKHNRQMMFWGDILLSHPELIKELPQDVVALNWGYEANDVTPESCQAFQASGITFDVCPGTSSWCSFAGRWTHAKQNLLQSAKNGLQHGARGYLITDWGDQGHIQPPEASTLQAAWGAGLAWCVQSNQNEPRYLESIKALMPSFPVNAWHQLADLYTHTKPTPKNRTTLFNLFTFPEEPLDAPRYEGLSLASLEEASAIANQLSTSNSIQLVFTAKLLGFCADLGAAIAQSPEQSLTALPQTQRTALCDRLDDLAQQHTTIWRTTHRPGGLTVSLAYFDRLCLYLQGATPDPILT